MFFYKSWLKINLRVRFSSCLDFIRHFFDAFTSFQPFALIAKILLVFKWIVPLLQEEP